MTENRIEVHPDGVTVYNLEVEAAHTYFVLAEHAPAGAEGVWVHHAGCDYGCVSAKWLGIER